MDLELEGRVFLLTGASTGLGYALAERLTRERARVGLMARSGDRLASAAERLRTLGGDVMNLAGDVREPGDLARFVQDSMQRWGQIDGVVNNAGELSQGPFAQHDDAAWEADIALKLMAAVRLIRLVLPALRRSQGSILNTLAISGKAPDALTTPTSISRAGGLALTKALSRELAPDGIRVNAVLIGVVASGQLEHLAALRQMSPEDYYDHMVRSCGIPLGRVGRPAEFADLAAFLLSARASYITGTAVNLDGGLSPVV